MAGRGTLAGAAVAAVTAVGLLIPIPYTAAPTWDVWVVDANGAPVSGRTVWLSYRNYSAEATGHEVDLVTDPRGHVQFPKERDMAMAGSFVVNTVRSAMAGVHASFGRSAYVFALGEALDISEGEDNKVNFWHGTPQAMTSRFLAR